MEGRWGGKKGRAVDREERGGSEQRSSGSPSKRFIPSGETGFLCGERERRAGGEKERWRHEARGKCREKGKMHFFPTFPAPFSLPVFLPDMCALALHTAGYSLRMIYLCAGAGRHGKSGLDKGIAVSPWSFL